ncbi:hypothetical protein ACFOW1_10300 [Parasediminibacterium paludis]|uniref:DUF4306 domain-containing protein n=1 Tax=Parasediminibacterium paludis TaxID=908966 RepID=A0ABV8PYS5_9BACT
MRKIFIVIFGVSLLIGLLSGYMSAKTKYFYLSPSKPKREITYETYKMYFDKTINWESDYTKFLTIEKVYNTQNATLFGLTSLGVLLIVSYFIPQSKKNADG